MSNVTIRPIDLDQDAERLATMWNQSDEGWPHSWTDGQPITADGKARPNELALDAVGMPRIAEPHAGFLSPLEPMKLEAGKVALFRKGLECRPNLLLRPGLLHRGGKLR